MKKVVVIGTCFLTTFFAANAQSGKPTTTVKPTPVKTIAVKPPVVVLKTLLDSFSYMAGYNVATNMKEQGITDLNTAIMQKGIDDYFKSRPPLMTPEVGNKSLQRQLDIFAKTKADAEKKVADVERAKCTEFLNNNKKRAGVITLPDGLQYEILKAGDAAANKPKSTDTVVVNYIGTLINGTEFDNSIKRGQAAVFPADRVIKGWTEILQLMSVGAHWKVYIPAELAYGDNPPPGSPIAAGAALIFEITLEGIKPAAATTEKPKE